MAGNKGIKVLAVPATEKDEPSKFVIGRNVPLGVLQTLKVMLHETNVDGKNNPVGDAPPHSNTDEDVAFKATLT